MSSIITVNEGDNKISLSFRDNRDIYGITELHSFKVEGCPEWFSDEVNVNRLYYKLWQGIIIESQNESPGNSMLVVHAIDNRISNPDNEKSSNSNAVGQCCMADFCEYMQFDKSSSVYDANCAVALATYTFPLRELESEGDVEFITNAYGLHPVECVL